MSLEQIYCSNNNKLKLSNRFGMAAQLVCIMVTDSLIFRGYVIMPKTGKTYFETYSLLSVAEEIKNLILTIWADHILV